MAISDDLVAYWRFEDNVDDDGGAGHDGTNSGGAFVTGRTGFGEALSFDGVNDIATFGGVASASSLALQPNAGTISAWIKSDSNSASPGAIVFGAYRATPGGGNADYGGALFHSYGGAGRLMFNLGNDVGYAYEITNSGIVIGTWYHVAMSWEIEFSDSGDLKCYVNGAPASEFSAVTRSSGSTPFDPSDDKDDRKFVLGGYYDGGSDLYFDGTLDDMAVWSRVLSDAELEEIYDAGVAGDPLSTLLTSDNISTVGGIAWSSVATVGGVAAASIAKISGVPISA